MKKFNPNDKDIISNTIIETIVAPFDPSSPVVETVVEEEAVINENEGVQIRKQNIKRDCFLCDGCHRYHPILKLDISREEPTGNNIIKISKDGEKVITPQMKQINYCKHCSSIIRFRKFISFFIAPIKSFSKGDEE